MYIIIIIIIMYSNTCVYSTYYYYCTSYIDYTLCYLLLPLLYSKQGRRGRPRDGAARLGLMLIVLTSNMNNSNLLLSD